MSPGSEPPSGIEASGQRGRQWSFAWQLGVLVSLLLLATCATLGVVSYDVARRIIRSEIHSRLHVVANERRELIREYVDRQQERVALIASRTQFRKLIDEFQRGEIDESSMRAGTVRILEDALASTPDFLSVWVVDRQGRVLTASASGLLKQDFSDAPGLKFVLESERGEFRYHFGEPYEREDQLLARLCAPARIRDGELLGVVMVELDVDRMRAILAGESLSNELGKTGEVLLGRRDGDGVRLLLRSRRSGKAVLSADDTPNMLDAIDGASGFEISDFDGVPVLMHFQPFPFQPGGAPWALVATIDREEAYVPLVDLRKALVASGAGLLSLGLILTILTARRMTRPVSQLTSAVDALANSGEIQLVDADRNDEFGRLATSFNAMAKRIFELNTGLEDEVAERTSALQYSNAELDRVKSRLELVLKASVRAAVIATGNDGRVTVFNAGAEQLLGYSADEVVGRRTPVIWHDADEVEARAAALEAELGRPVSGFDTFVIKAVESGYDEQEWTFTRKDGERRLVLLNVTPQLEQGEIVGFVGVGVDITERKKHEAELLEATRAAQAANRAKSQFLANMSHEIRTPLNAVIGLTEIVLQTELTAEQREHLLTVMTSADSLLDVINDILDFSRIEAGRLELDSVPFSVSDTVGDTLKALAVRAEQKGLELVCFVDPDVPGIVVGDPGRLRQVITNLAGNAIKFTEQGEVVVGVEVESSGEDPVLRFFVRDSGIGIDPDEVDRLFESFEQADASTTRVFGGTGLGLAISRQLVELMGGEITAVSSPGMGSTFHFTAAFLLPEAEQVFGPADFVPLKGRRVLIVDDNQTNREILELVTQAKQMKAAVAESAEAGLQLLTQAADAGEPFDVLLSDLHMPKRDGFMFIESVRRDARFKELPSIFLTSASEPGDRQRGRGLGVSEWLTKPVKQSELYEAMLRALSGSPGGVPTGAGVVRLSGKEPTDASAVSDSQLEPLRILLVEDSVPNQKVALAILASGSHAVSIAENGREALQRLRSDDFDVVLMDVQMPEMDGFEATARIRSEEEETGRHQVIVAMTAHALQGDREKCLAAGMDDYVTKPVRRGELFQVLARVVGRSELRENTECGVGETRGASESSAGLSRIDLSGPLQQVNGDESVLAGICESYRQEGSQTLDRLPGLIAAGDWFEVRRAAHTVKAAMRMFGVAPAVELGQELEDLAGTGKLEDAVELLGRFRRAVEPALEELAHFVDTGELPHAEGDSK